MKRAGAGVPSANRITLLRDADGDGVAETRSVFMREPEFALRHGAGRQRAVRRQRRRRGASFPYAAGQTRITAAPAKVTDLPAGINHHWTKNIIASRGRQQAVRDRGLQQQHRRERHGDRGGPRRRSGRSTARPAQKRLFASGLRNPNGLALGAGDRRAVDGGQRTRRAGQRPGARLPDLGEGRRLLRLALELLGPARR